MRRLTNALARAAEQKKLKNARRFVLLFPTAQQPAIEAIMHDVDMNQLLALLSPGASTLEELIQATKREDLAITMDALIKKYQGLSLFKLYLELFTHDGQYEIINLLKNHTIDELLEHMGSPNVQGAIEALKKKRIPTKT